MTLPHRVQPGDCLWGLAGRYLGEPGRWPLILDFHNREARRFGLHSRLLPIEDPDLIFVGQTVMIPPRTKNPPPGTGARDRAAKPATAIDLKVAYTIGRDTPPVEYLLSTVDYTLKTEMSGTIALELVGGECYRHNLELLVSKDAFQVKQKLAHIYDQALSALTAAPEMVLETGKIRIKAPIAVHARIGPYAITAQTDAPNHFTGTLSPPALAGKITVGGQDYKYSAEIEYKMDITMHPIQRTFRENSKTRTAKPNTGAGIYELKSGPNWNRDIRDTGNFPVRVTIATAFADRLPHVMAAQAARLSMPMIHCVNSTTPANMDGYEL